MMTSKRYCQILAALLIVMLIIAGCSGNGANENKQANEGNDGGNVASNRTDEGNNASGQGDEEPIVIKWLSFDPPDEDGNPVQVYLEEKFNVKIENMRIDRSNWAEQLNIRLAGGDIPDLFFLWSSNDIMTYSDQGVLAELSVDEIKQHMPKYAATVDAQDENLWKYGTVNGRNFSIPLYWEMGAHARPFAYNKSWMEAVGTTQAPTTLEELEALMSQFRNADPDGNGTMDTYGTTTRGNDNLYGAFIPVFGAYGTLWNVWAPNEAGELQNSVTTKRVQEALITLNRWYADGLIDKEFITSDADKVRQAFYNGKVGMSMVEDWTAYHTNGLIYQNFVSMNPGEEIVVSRPVEGPYGPGVAHAYGLRNNYVGMGVQVEQDERKRLKIYEILESLASDPETYLMAVHGIEGEHYTMVDGTPVMKEEYAPSSMRGSFGGGTYYGIFGGGKSTMMSEYVFTKDQLALFADVIEGTPTLVNYKQFPVAAERDFPDLGKLQAEYLINFITGALDPATDFDAFVERWHNAGGAEMTRQVNETYNELMNE